MRNISEAPDPDAPSPGSYDAQQRGCTCPQADNGWGSGFMNDSTYNGYVIALTCPLHGGRVKEVDPQAQGKLIEGFPMSWVSALPPSGMTESFLVTDFLSVTSQDGSSLLPGYLQRPVHYFTCPRCSANMNKPPQAKHVTHGCGLSFFRRGNVLDIYSTEL